MKDENNEIQQISEPATDVVLVFPDSMHACAGCTEMTLEPGQYCEDCQRINAMLEARYRESSARPEEPGAPITMSDICELQDTVDCGVVPRPSQLERLLVWTGLLMLLLMSWAGVVSLVGHGLHRVWPHSF